MDAEQKARENLLRESEEIAGTVVRGYEFNEGVDYTKIVGEFGSMGHQATEFSRAVGIVNTMIAEKATIFLGYTSNMVSSGLREIFRYLVEHKKVQLIVTTAGGIEEDIIKCLGDFIIGDFKADGKELRERGINRIGNIFVPNNRYVAFEQWVQPILEELYQEQLAGKKICASDVIWKLGEKINDTRSICYWAWKNQIRIFCPALSDGALGDNLYFFSFKRPDFVIDMVEDTKRLNDATIGLQRLGLVILGSGVVKHSLLNAAMLRNGAEYAVYINTAQEFDGSDAGASPDEAVSWGKLSSLGKSVKVFGDATILFPLLVAQTFAKE
ncbi:MAG TPA: deoxyhypusine synthase [Candidatus Nanoarchaeia archaeon]|nr:deoxyhypusine synthase [Candidatus Nanoarchaeia archaeon]